MTPAALMSSAIVKVEPGGSKLVKVGFCACSHTATKEVKRINIRMLTGLITTSIRKLVFNLLARFKPQTRLKCPLNESRSIWCCLGKNPTWTLTFREFSRISAHSSSIYSCEKGSRTGPNSNSATVWAPRNCGWTAYSWLFGLQCGRFERVETGWGEFSEGRGYRASSPIST